MPTVFFLKYKFYILILFAFYPAIIRRVFELLLSGSFEKLLGSGSSNTFKTPVVTQYKTKISSISDLVLYKGNFLPGLGDGESAVQCAGNFFFAGIFKRHSCLAKVKKRFLEVGSLTITEYRLSELSKNKLLFLPKTFLTK
jgi:hypothetical protein